MFISFGLNFFLTYFLANSFIPFIFCLLRPHFFKFEVEIKLTTFGFTFPL
ncbi:uncharacterized protein METZ01_LOCUS424583, partial [marine metagenome]